MIDYGPARHSHTPAELADFAILRDRQRAEPDDSAPIMRTLYQEDGSKVREPMPWRDAMELDR